MLKREVAELPGQFELLPGEHVRGYQVHRTSMRCDEFIVRLEVFPRLDSAAIVMNSGSRISNLIMPGLHFLIRRPPVGDALVVQ